MDDASPGHPTHNDSAASWNARSPFASPPAAVVNVMPSSSACTVNGKRLETMITLPWLVIELPPRPADDVHHKPHDVPRAIGSTGDLRSKVKGQRSKVKGQRSKVRSRFTLRHFT